MNNWHGLVKILEIQHVRNEQVIWEDKNLFNILHVGGEAFILSCCFDNPGREFPPDYYYFGLDNRATLSVDDVMTDLYDEPVGNGYVRQPARATETGEARNNFTIEDVGGVFRATSQLITFSASGSGWGPVTNLFLTTKNDNSEGSILISSNKLTSSLILVAGDIVRVRMALALRDKSIS